MARSLSNMMLKGLAGFPATNPLRTAVAKGSFFKCDIKWSTTVTHDPDTHEDFQPTNKLTGSGSSIQDIVEEDVQKHPIMIYMKGVPDAPRCGFSALAVKVLKEYGIPIRARNILEDQELKNGVKSVSNWPTFPQIFIKGEFIGGSDIVLNMHQRSWGIAHWLVSVQYMTILLIKREKKSILVNCEAAQLVAHTLTALRSKISELRI